jgi:pimeloyl-ACP methyl ester carboxylesterase
MQLRSTIAAGLIGTALLGASAQAQSAPDVKVAHADYSNPAIWLCKPGLKADKCKVDLDATVIPANGKTSLERFVAAKDPKIDCFFVYPTVSLDPGWQSDFVPDKMEFDDVKLQFARFGSICRLFAPVYRQTTLTALRVASGGPAPAGERPPAGVGGYSDVVDAWNYYLSHDNKGRGVVLIGHSQGAGLISRLIAQEIEGKPAQKQFISGIILGSAVMVPEGKDVGGSYKTIPLCRKEDQVGCVISYMSFRDRNPPPPESRFGKSRDGLFAACTNPANLASGKGEPESYFLTKGFLNGSGGDHQPDWLNPHQDIKTPFVKTPGLVTTTCVHKGDFTYLEMHVNGDPKDPRTDELAGEVIRATGPDLSWGLHLIDMDHSMGDLVRIVKKEAAAYAASAAKPH